MKRNLFIFITIVLITFIVIAIKFGTIQISQAGELRESVVDQRVKTIKEFPERGAIKDRKGNTIAMSLNVKDIAVYPNLMKSDKTKETIATTLSDILSINKEEILEKINRTDKNGNPIPWVRIAKRVDVESANEIKESNVANFVEISSSPQRHYLNGPLASNILGFVNDLAEPGAGIELSLNKYLGGIPGYRIVEVDSMGEIIPIGLSTVSKPIAGSDVYLTIDSYIQHILDETLKEAQETMNPEQMHAVIMDPNTGEILAMSSYPNFDPNDYQAYDDSTYNNHAASFVYEPGSTIKPMYMSIALDEGTINGNTTFTDTGSINLNGTSISNWNHKGRGTTTLEEIILDSSNVGMVRISQTLTEEQVHKGLLKAGFGQKTGIQLPNEEIGLFPSVEKLKKDPLVKATESFGHGLAVTPLQIITSFSEVINGGYDITPTLIKKVVDSSGNEMYRPDEKRERVWTEETANLVKGYLKGTYDSNNNTIEGFDGGIKTGTATKAGKGGYTNDIIGSYVGFVPFDDPKYIMIAVVDNPRNPGYIFGNTAAGPIFQQAMTEVLEYSNIEETVKDETEEEEEKGEIVYQVPNVKLSFYEQAKALIEEQLGNDVKVVKKGKGNIVIGQTFSYQHDVLNIELETSAIKGKGKTYIPNLEGMKKIEVYDLFVDQGIEIEFIGDGTVYHQEVSTGEYDKSIKTIRIWLE